MNQLPSKRRIIVKPVDVPKDFWETWPESPHCKLKPPTTGGSKEAWENVAKTVLGGHYDLADWSTVRSVEIGVRAFHGEPFDAAYKYVKELKKAETTAQRMRAGRIMVKSEHPQWREEWIVRRVRELKRAVS